MTQEVAQTPPQAHTVGSQDVQAKQLSEQDSQVKTPEEVIAQESQNQNTEVEEVIAQDVTDKPQEPTEEQAMASTENTNQETLAESSPLIDYVAYGALALGLLGFGFVFSKRRKFKLRPKKGHTQPSDTQATQITQVG